MFALLTSLVTPLLLKVSILGLVRWQKLSHPDHMFKCELELQGGT